jgi:hypothetical protein
MPLNVDLLNTGSLSVNGADMCKVSTPVFDIFPWPIFPKFEKTCTEVRDTSGQGLSLQGYKITGAIQNFGDTSYENYLGTIRVKNGNNFSFPYLAAELPFKSTGFVTYYPDSFGDISASNVLGFVNKAWDSTNDYTVYFETEFVQFVSFEIDGNDLLIDIVSFSDVSDLNIDPVSVMEYVMSFELELLLPNSVEISYEYIEFLP